MRREIYQVSAMIIDANGTFNNLSGYPKQFDSKVYDNDVDKCLNRAKSDWHEVLGAMYKRDDRLLQEAWIVRVSDGVMMYGEIVGAMPEEPDPEPEPEPEVIEGE